MLCSSFRRTPYTQISQQFQNGQKNLPLEVGEVSGPYWTRTSDPIDVNDVLYQLSQRTNLVSFLTIFYILGQNFGCAPGNVCTTD